MSSKLLSADILIRYAALNRFANLRFLNYLQKKNFPYIIVAIAYTSYLLMFIVSFDRLKFGITPLTMIPVVLASWYFGIKGGTLIASISILVNRRVPTTFGHSPGYILWRMDRANNCRWFRVWRSIGV